MRSAAAVIIAGDSLPNEAPAGRGARLVASRISERGHRPGEPETSPEALSRYRRLALKARKDAYFPSHVRHCVHNPLRDGVWTLANWRWSDPGGLVLRAYSCGSFRCPSVECQRYAAHRDYARLREAITRHGPDDWCLFVLTIDRFGTLGARRGGKPWRDEQEAFASLSRMTRDFLARLRRMVRAREGDPAFPWAATVEIQRNGWPHLNLLIKSREVARVIDWESCGKANRRALHGEILRHATECDWGAVGTAERVENLEAIANYMVKAGAESHRIPNELAKLTQAPTNARMKLRRIRSSIRFFSPRKKSLDWTGIMLRRRRYERTTLLDRHGRQLRTETQWVAEPMMRPDQVRCGPEKQPAYVAGASQAIRVAQEQIASEARGAPFAHYLDLRKTGELPEGGERLARMASDPTTSRARTRGAP